MEGKVGPHDMQAKSTCKYILWLWGRGIWMGGPKALSPLYTLLVPLPSLIICGGGPLPALARYGIWEKEGRGSE